MHIKNLEEISIELSEVSACLSMLAASMEGESNVKPSDGIIAGAVNSVSTHIARLHSDLGQIIAEEASQTSSAYCKRLKSYETEKTRLIEENPDMPANIFANHLAALQKKWNV